MPDPAAGAGGSPAGVTELLIVSGSPVWPEGDHASGRTAGLVEALARRFSVRVLAPAGGPPSEGVVVGVDDLPDEEPTPRVVAVLSPQSRLGRALLGPRRSQVLLRMVAEHRPVAVMFSAGHLAAAAPTIDRPIFVDFPELSVRRPPGGGRMAALESAKARWWEPNEARRAVAVSAATADDVDRLASWGARAVLVPQAATAAAWREASAPLADVVERVVRPA